MKCRSKKFEFIKTSLDKNSTFASWIWPQSSWVEQLQLKTNEISLFSQKNGSPQTRSNCWSTSSLFCMKHSAQIKSGGIWIRITDVNDICHYVGQKAAVLTWEEWCANCWNVIGLFTAISLSCVLWLGRPALDKLKTTGLFHNNFPYDVEVNIRKA